VGGRGCEVTYGVITRGDKSSDDPEMTPDRLAAIREEEQRDAGAIIGVNYGNHSDHRVAGDAAIDAVFPRARDRLTFSERARDGLEPHKGTELWLGFTEHSSGAVDIGPVAELKKQALLAHPGQLSPEGVDFALEMSKEMAEAEEFEYAEMFREMILEEPER